MSNFKKCEIDEFNINPFKDIKQNYFLITAGSSTNNYNTMTANWATMGTIWNKPIINIFIRPQRYTFQFIESNKNFSICFFDNKYKPELEMCGKISGREINKAKKANFTPILEDDTIYFAEANIVIICSKIYSSDFEKLKIIDKDIEKFYEKNGMHRLYIAEIKKILKK